MVSAANRHSQRIRSALASVQRKQLELLSDIARQMEESLQAISVVIQELKEQK